MRKVLIILLPILCSGFSAQARNVDHRVHNVDSLETVLVRWTAAKLAEADEAELKSVAMNLEELMYGFNQTNPAKSEDYAHMLMDIARRMGWQYHMVQAAKGIGQHFWAKGRLDSAAFYYGIALDVASGMNTVEEEEADQVETFSQTEKDYALSQMYGSLGNLYSTMDSTDRAMEY